MLAMFDNLTPATETESGIVEPLEGAGTVDLSAVINRITALETAVEELRATMAQKQDETPETMDETGETMDDSTPETTDDSTPENGNITNDEE